MNTILKQDTEKKRSNLLRSDLNRYLLDKNQIKGYPKHMWFKGSRFR